MKTDYYYEICDKNEDVVETDFVCLDTAIEYALKHGGETINQCWVEIKSDNWGDGKEGEVIAAEIVWKREK